MWYRQGTVTVTNGSNVVTGAGTDFVANASIGDAFIGPDGRTYEIAQIVSATDLRLTTGYQAATGGGQAYAIQPTQSFARDLALAAAALLSTFAAVRDGVGQGLFGDGSAAAPAIRFSADQDTGIRRVGSNVIALVTGGQDILTAGTYVGIGTGNPLHKLHVNSFSTDPTFALVGNNTNGIGIGIRGDGFPAILSYLGTGMAFGGGLGGSTIEYGRFDSSGRLGIGTTEPRSRHHVKAAVGGEIACFETPAARGGGNGYLSFYDTGGRKSYWGYGSLSDDFSIYNECAGGAITFGTVALERARIDSAGNFLVGATSGSCHIFDKPGAQGTLQFRVNAAQLGTAPLSVFAANVNGYNAGQATVLAIATNTVSGRSLSAGGTINASGADYAEYVLKAAGCGLIAKGDVCGVDREGRLTKTWADAISFVVKSTDPSYVGGDTWAAHLPPRPEAPGAEPVVPIKPGDAPVATVEPGPEPAEEGLVYVAWLNIRFAFAVAEREYAIALAEWQAATDAYPAARSAYEADHAAWVAATVAYERDLPAWEADLEAARQCVDRIAFCGQVPCNVTGDFEVGDYIVAAANGGGIKAVAMKLDDMTLAQYARRIGKVWAIRDGRAWIDVQHG